MSQFESVFDPLNSLFATDFSSPEEFMKNLRARAEAAQSSGGGGGKPKAPKAPKDTTPAPPAPAAAAPTSPTQLSERDKFKQSLLPYRDARIRMANNPLSVKRAQQWEANQMAGFDAREKRRLREERQLASLLEQAKQRKAQQEQARQYRANLSNEIYESEKYGEQNPAKPTGPSPEEQMAANRAAVKADNDYIMALNAQRREEERQQELLFGYDKAEAARLRGADERAAAADAAAKARTQSTLLPRDVNALMAQTPTGQLASLASPMQGNVTTPLNPQPYPTTRPPLGLVAASQAADRELFDQQMAEAEREKKVQALVEGTMANYNAGRNTSPAPALGQRNPEAEAMAARAPRLSRSEIPAGVPTMGGADQEQVAFNQKVQELMSRGVSNAEAVSIARGENPGVYERAQQNAMRDPNITAYDPQGLNTMSALETLAGEGTMALGAKGLRAAGILGPAAPRAVATAAPVETRMAPEVRSAPAQTNRATAPANENWLRNEIRYFERRLRNFDEANIPVDNVQRGPYMAAKEKIQQQIAELKARLSPPNPTINTSPADVPAGPTFARPGDTLPPLEGAARRRPDRLSPEGIEAAQKEGMLFDIGAPAAPPKAAPAAAAEAAAAAPKSAPKGQMTFDQLYEAPKPTAAGPAGPTKAQKFEALAPDAQKAELAKAYDKSFRELRAGRMTQPQFDQMVANTLKGKHGAIFREVLESFSFSKVKQAKSAVDEVLGSSATLGATDL